MIFGFFSFHSVLFRDPSSLLYCVSFDLLTFCGCLSLFLTFRISLDWVGQKEFRASGTLSISSIAGFMDARGRLLYWYYVRILVCMGMVMGMVMVTNSIKFLSNLQTE